MIWECQAELFKKASRNNELRSTGSHLAASLSLLVQRCDLQCRCDVDLIWNDWWCVLHCVVRVVAPQSV